MTALIYCAQQSAFRGGATLPLLPKADSTTVTADSTAYTGDMTI